ncbi:MAG: hypothetical protein IKS32_09855, partial [Solobacterium sp.]|nr:hypothetical protein [Solobacterium sp.]
MEFRHIRMRLDDPAETIPEPYRSQFLQILDEDFLFVSDEEACIRKLKRLLKRYSDEETGRVRLELVRLLMRTEKTEQAKSILKQLAGMENCRYMVKYWDAYIAYHCSDDPSAAYQNLSGIEWAYTADYATILMLRSQLAGEIYGEDAKAGSLESGIEEAKQYAGGRTDAAAVAAFLFSQLVMLDDSMDQIEMYRWDMRAFGQFLLQVSDPNKQLVSETLDLALNLMIDEQDTESLFFRISARTLRKAETENPGVVPEELLKLIRVKEQLLKLDERADVPPMLSRYLDYYYSEDPMNPENEYLMLDLWSLAAQQKETPGYLAGLAKQYPDLFSEEENDLFDVIHHPGRVKKECESNYAQYTDCSLRESRKVMKLYYDTHRYHFAEIAGVDLSVCSSETLPLILELFAADRFENYETVCETADELAEYELNELEEPVLWLRTAAMIGMGKHNETGRSIRLLERLEQKPFHACLAEALKEEQNQQYDAVVKILEPMMPLEDEIPRAFECLRNALCRLSDAERCRRLFEEEIAYVRKLREETDREKASAKQNSILSSLYELILLQMGADVWFSDQKRLQQDIEALKQQLSGEALNGFDEEALARGFSRFSGYANRAEWSSDLFLALTVWLEEHHMFRTQPGLIESAYKSFESYRFYDDLQISDSLKDVIQYINALQDGEQSLDESIQYSILVSFWQLTRVLEDDPEQIDYAADRYPHYAGPFRQLLKEIAAHPEDFRGQME